jgi:hypothetical protein
MHRDPLPARKSYGGLTGSADALALTRLAATARPLAVLSASALDARRLLEEIGLAPRGEAGKRARDGYFNREGKLPLNTHGGLLSYGHCGCGGAMAHLVETHQQMTGRAAARQVKDASLALLHGDGQYAPEKLPDLLMYQKNLFALPSASNEALVMLYPLPAHNHAWYYAWLDLRQFPFLKSRALYQHYVYFSRMHSILKNISIYKPEVVLMYGMDNINLLKKSVQEFFRSAKFRMVKAVKGQIPQYHRADFNETTILITTQIPALRHNRVDTGFDWYEFGKLVKVTL